MTNFRQLVTSPYLGILEPYVYISYGTNKTVIFEIHVRNVVICIQMNLKMYVPIPYCDISCIGMAATIPNSSWNVWAETYRVPLLIVQRHVWHAHGNASRICKWNQTLSLPLSESSFGRLHDVWLFNILETCTSEHVDAR